MARHARWRLSHMRSNAGWPVSPKSAKLRTEASLADHRRVHEAARDVGQYSVSPCLPVDLMGV